MQKTIHDALFLAFFLFLFILFGFNEWNGDRAAYEGLFDGSSWISAEPGYTFINNYFYEIGFTYDQFQIVVAFTCIYLIWRYAANNIKNRLLFAIFYGITLFPLDYVLIRNFLSFAMLIQGISLLNSNKKNRILFCTIFILIATTIHQSALFFLIFLFARKEKIDPYKFFLIAFTYSALFFVVKNFIFSMMGVADHLLIYKQTPKAGIANIAIHTAAILPAMYISGKYPNASQGNNIYNMNMLSILFFPLYFESEIFIRLLRVIIFLNVCYFIDLPRTRSYALYSFLYIIIFSLFLFFYFNLPFFDDSVAPLFKNNKLINSILS